MSAPPPPRVAGVRRAGLRLAAGRARALGMATRGTTNPNRLRRMDNWLIHRLGPLLRHAAEPLVIDLGFGANPVTTIELHSRLMSVRADIRVLGLEIDATRVSAAQPAARPPHLTFGHGGFELARARPVVVRAANVLRQYGEAAALGAWETMQAALAPGGALVEGTCDELGRLGGWVLLDADGPRELVLSCRIATLGRPSDLAQRLPKALIHHNVPGQPIQALLAELDRGWDAAAALAPFGARQRWLAACAAVRDSHWPVDISRARFGELAISWAAVRPVDA